jgi:tetratricopeptide (TPR) repeat protein
MASCLLTAAASAAPPGDADCDDPAAVVRVVKGRVEIKREEESDWEAAQIGVTVCIGGSIRTYDDSRAEFAIADRAESNLDENTEIAFLPAGENEENHLWLKIWHGLIHIINRGDNTLKITTPHVNAGLLGTEFQVRVDGDDLDMSVYEGQVELTSEAGELILDPRHHVTARSGVFGAAEVNDSERADLIWAQHFPTLIARRLPAPDAEVAGSDAGALVARAQQRLLFGRIDAASADTAAALVVEPGSADAYALQALISLANGRRNEARERINTALANEPESAAALMARSYLLMGEGARYTALDAMKLAVAHDPENPLVQARFAEVSLQTDAVAESLRAAERALLIDSELASPHWVLGFAALKVGDIESAQAQFDEASRRDAAAALPHIGTAFVRYRTGERAAALRELEIAVALEANDSTIRSYMARAYADAAQAMIARDQLARANGLDPADPTAWLYGALISAGENDPVGAVRKLGKVEELSGDAAPLRSGLFEDDDLVTRSAGVGGVYRTLGFERQALQSAWRANVADPMDFAPHRLSADVYPAFARSQVLRVNEAYQARLLEPLSVLPTPPQIAEANLFILDSVGPTDLASQQGRSSFVENGLNFQASAVRGSYASFGEDLVLSGLGNRGAFNLGQYHFETEGFRPNNDIELDVLSGFAQVRASASTTLQLELRATRTEKGDMQLRFLESDYDPSVRDNEDQDSIRFGALHRVGARTSIVGSFVLSRSEILIDSTESSFMLHVLADTGTAELQALHRGRVWSLASGMRVHRASRDDHVTLRLTLPDPPYVIEDTSATVTKTRHVMAYLYANGQVTDTLLLSLGASLEHLDGFIPDVSRRNPKLGLTWQPSPATQLRVAYYETMFGHASSKQLVDPSLEPMQVAGFGQYVFRAEGEISKNSALAIDHDLTANLSIGAERTASNVLLPYWTHPPNSAELIVGYLRYREVSDTVYLQWSAGPRLALKTALQYEDFDYYGEFSPFGYARLRTWRLPLEAMIVVGNSLNIQVTGTRLSQRGVFAYTVPGPAVWIPGEDQFWVFDAGVSYRLPNRRGSVELGIKNLLDEEFRFQDTDPENPHVFPRRFASFRFSLSF